MRSILQADNDNKVATVVFDIDGVLADNSRRYERLDPANPDWKNFHKGQHLDPPIEGNVTLLKMLWDGGYNVVLATNRFEVYRAQTMQWLRRPDIMIPFTRLVMRQKGQPYIGAKTTMVQGLIEEGIRVVLYVDDDLDHCQGVTRDTDVPHLYVHSGYNEHFGGNTVGVPDDPAGAV